MSFVTQLFVYPIKSCRGVARESIQVSPDGVEGDRVFMVVDEAGKFITARTTPELLLVDVEETSEHFVATAPDGKQLRLAKEENGLSEDCSVQVWSDAPLAQRHEEGSEFFSEYLKRPVRLVRLPKSRYRQVDPKRALPNDRVGFADAYPLLMLSEASLNELNSRIERSGRPTISLARFRPNIVIDGARPHEEDDLRDFYLGDIRLTMPKLCDRCVMTTHDPLTGQGGPEPLRTLAQYRKWDGKVWFGANLLIRGSGSLRRGMPLLV